MRLVRLVEIGNTVSEEAQAIVSEDLSVFRDKGIDTLVLGCTHFPLLSELISRAMGPDVACEPPRDRAGSEGAAVKLDETQEGRRRDRGCSMAQVLHERRPGDVQALGSLFQAGYRKRGRVVF